MPTPDLLTLSDSIAWCYANLARAHAALTEGAGRYGPKHYMIRARMYSGLRSGTLSMRGLADDERSKLLRERLCVYCGGVDRLSLDHLIARGAGGPDMADNIVLACRSCNSSKRDADLIDWLATSHRFPSIYLLRRYLKLTAQQAERDGTRAAARDDPAVRSQAGRMIRMSRNFPQPEYLRLDEVMPLTWLDHASGRKSGTDR